MIRRGWYGQSARHSLAARGVRTNSPYLKAKFLRDVDGKKITGQTSKDSKAFDEYQAELMKAGAPDVEKMLLDAEEAYNGGTESEQKELIESIEASTSHMKTAREKGVEYYKKKDIEITAEPHEEGRAYPITPQDAQNILEHQKDDDLKSLKAIRFEDPKNVHQRDAWAQYKRGKREVVIFSQDANEITPQTHMMMKEHVVPHEIGHHVALTRRNITDKNLAVAEARADAHAAGFDVEDQDIHKFREDIHPIAYAKEKEFDFAKIKGEWVQKSVKGNPPFQKGCKDVQAKYTPQKDGTIKVENSCTINGKNRSMIGTARKVGNKELEVDFFPGIPFTAGEFKVKKYSGDKMTVKGGKYEWELERKNKRRSYNYTPTYVAGDLPLIAADGVGTAGAATVGLIPLAVTAGALYVGGSLIKKQYDSAKNSTKKRKKSTKSRKKSKK